ncbi:MAG: class II fructose-bisphosphate aldolase [Dermabacter sp.]|nr:class II fructose-bisphosphate aldolase [Dermabacter sp.]
MIVSLTDALAHAERTRTAIAAVNTPFFEALLATIEVGERTGTPIILQFAQVHEDVMSIDNIGPAMVELARRSPAPFVVHVDHGEDREYIERGLEIGFNSCMIDGSRHPFETNVRLTADVVAMAHERGVAVEGELGVMTGNENGNPSQGIADSTLFTDPDQAREFVERTGVDCLAASFGTVHGLYRQAPSLNLPLISRLRDTAGVPLVMHGGSGLSAEDYRASIARGVRKINYYTYAAGAAYDAVVPLVQEGKGTLFPTLAVAAQHAVETDVARFVDLVSTPENEGPATENRNER